MGWREAAESYSSDSLSQHIFGKLWTSTTCELSGVDFKDENKLLTNLQRSEGDEETCEANEKNLPFPFSNFTFFQNHNKGRYVLRET